MRKSVSVLHVCNHINAEGVKNAPFSSRVILKQNICSFVKLPKIKRCRILFIWAFMYTSNVQFICNESKGLPEYFFLY